MVEKKNAGYTRAEIVEKLHLTDGISITKNLNALITGDFFTIILER